MANGDKSSWIATRFFLIGLSIAIVSSFLIASFLPYFILYHTSLKAEGFAWCDECSGWTFALGEQLTNVTLGISFAALAFSVVIFVVTKRRHHPTPDR